MARGRGVVLVAAALLSGAPERALAQCPATTLFEEDSEGGLLPTHWSAGSPMWKVVADTACGPACQHGSYAYFGRTTIASCDCAVSGPSICMGAWLWSPTISLPTIAGGEQLVLDFCFEGLLDTAYADCSKLAIEHPAGIAEHKLGKHFFIPCPGPETQPPYDLSAFAGQPIRLGRYVGWVDEGGRGYMKVDDVHVRLYRPDAGSDCNHNLIRDDCDIGLGLIPDENQDGIPDDCQCFARTYCRTSPNSTSAGGALLRAGGALSTFQNSLTLYVTQAAKGELGVFLASQEESLLPFASGVLCLSDPILRLASKTTNAGSGNTNHKLEFFGTQWPMTLIGPYEEWHLQFWYRDPAGGGAGANLSNGLTIRL